MTDEEHAKAVREAGDALNRAIDAAMGHGVSVDVEVHMLEDMERGMVPFLSVKVSRDLT